MHTESSDENDLDVDGLMHAIREAASKRDYKIAKADLLETTPARTFSSAEAENSHVRLALSPEFEARSDDAYHVNDLLRYQGRDFVTNAYRVVLKREPDEAGFLHNLTLLQSGAYNKIDILASLRSSDEGKRCAVRIDGLKLPATIRSVERIPVLGYVLQCLIGWARFPATLRSQRQFQEYVVAQQSLIGDYVNQLQESVRAELQQHAQQLARLDPLANEVAQHQAQLDSLAFTVRQTLPQRIEDGEEQLRQTAVRLAGLSDDLTDRFKNLSQLLLQAREELAQQSVASDELRRELKNANVLTDRMTMPGAERRSWDKLYAAFEEEFRGPVAEVEERLRFYLPFVRDLSREATILDLGSGRGDWLALLTQEGFQPRGVETNEVLADDCRKRGLNVETIDMMVCLRTLVANSVDVITVFHLIEHVGIDDLLHLLDQARRTLKPGGLLMLETPSPENIPVGACNFYADPTHNKPIYPHTLMFILRNLGFADCRLEFLHPVENSPFVGDSPGFPQLNQWFFGPRDFSVIARKPAE